MNILQYPERDYIYDLIDNYYDHPVLQKIKNINDMSMYAIRLSCMLLNEKRYLIVLCLQDNYPLNSFLPLSTLRWKSFMARTLEDDQFENLYIHTYSLKRQEKYTIPIHITKRSKVISIYQFDKYSDLKLSLLHLKGQEYEYPSNGNLVSALEVYQTILHWE